MTSRTFMEPTRHHHRARGTAGQSGSRATQVLGRHATHRSGSTQPGSAGRREGAREDARATFGVTRTLARKRARSGLPPTRASLARQARAGRVTRPARCASVQAL